MNPPAQPSYRDSLKSDQSDELINTYLLRPIAGVVVRFLYGTRVSPNQVTLLSTIAGIVAAALYLPGLPGFTAAAGLWVTIKDILDSADGQLARARQEYSRMGRFLDSIGDFLVNLLVFGAITAVLVRDTGSAIWLSLGVLGFLGISLRVSFHVFYQTSFLQLHRSSAVNRVTEEVREEDLKEEARVLMLQRIFLVLYGWQDALMVRLDRWSRARLPADSDTDRRWYADRVGLRLSGFLGIGTELFVLMLFSLLNRLDVYLLVNVLGMNGLWIACLAYRRWVLSPSLRRPHGAAS